MQKGGFAMGILDVLHVPATLPPGDYVLGCAPSPGSPCVAYRDHSLASVAGRWDCEATSRELPPSPLATRATPHLAPWGGTEVWTNCADVRLEH